MRIILKHKIISVLTVFFIGALFWTLTAGSLNPPSPPTSGTMKPLDEVEPRIAVNAANTPGGSNYTYRINQPGSYYLTGNVAVTTNLGGIRIDADDVTVDLMGYRIKNTYTGSKNHSGIYFYNRKNVMVKNGTVHGFYIGINSAGFNSSCNQLIGVRAVENISCGIYTYGFSDETYSGGSSVIRDCVAESNGFYGIHSSNGSFVENCVTKSNGDAGIFNGGYCIVRNCVSYYNVGVGIKSNAGSVVKNNISTENGGNGFHLSFGCVAKGNTAQRNGGHGIDAAGSGCTVIENSARDNQQHGIYAYQSLVDQNTAYNNNQSSGSYVNLSISGCTLGINHAP